MKHSFHRVSILPLLLASAVPSLQAAPPPPKPKPSDVAGADGRLTRDQQDVHVLRMKDEIFLKFDVNKNGVIDEGEASTLVGFLNGQKKTEILRSNRAIIDYGAAQRGWDSASLSPEQVNELVPPGKSLAYDPGVFRLRSKFTDFATPVKKKGEFAKVPAATFSYGRDYEKGADAWTAMGAVGFYWGRQGKGGPGYGLGAEFNRMDTSDESKKDVDSLIFKFAGVGQKVFRDSLLGALGWQVGVDYGTNFGFEGAVLGGSADLELQWDVYPFKNVHPFGADPEDSPSLLLRNFVHIEGGDTLDEIPDATDATGSYFRVGPRMEATFWPLGTDARISFNASYSIYPGLLEDDHTYRNLKAGLEWRLDDDGRWVAKAEYINGMSPLLLQDQETFLFSVGVRY